MSGDLLVCPPPPPSPTGAYDGAVRLWRRSSGDLVAVVKVQAGIINCMAWDLLGTRLYAGDSHGVLQEFACDAKSPQITGIAAGGMNGSDVTGASLSATQRSGIRAAAAHAAGINTAGAAGGAGFCQNAAGNQQQQPGGISLNASMVRPSTAPAGGRGGGTSSPLNSSLRPGALLGGGLNASIRGGGANLNASLAMLGVVNVGTAPNSATLGTACNSTAGSALGSTLQGGSGARVTSEALRALRRCEEFGGEGIASLALHPSGRRIAILTKRSRVIILESKSMSHAKQFLGIRSSGAPLKIDFSPDGRYLISGSEDGAVVIWDADGSPPTYLEHFRLGGDPVYQVRPRS